MLKRFQKTIKVLTSEPAHIVKAKALAHEIWEEPSHLHSEMVETVNATLIALHQKQIDQLSK